MTNARVSKFNTIVGNAPKGVDDKEAFWKQATLQAKLVLEEAQEQYDNCLVRNLVEVVDGACDVRYLQDYMNELLLVAGVNLEDAFDKVCTNNESKFTRSYEYAVMSALDHTASGVDSSVRAVPYQGDVYYVVYRTSDGKVLKMKDHIPPNLRTSIPDSVFDALDGE